jgi:basic membrane protein A
MKKILILGLALATALCFALVGCEKKAEAPAPVSAPTVTAPEAPAPMAPAAPAPMAPAKPAKK